MDEIDKTEKNHLFSNKEIENEIISDLKSQIKRSNESIEKSKIEIKSLKEQLKALQNEKISFEYKSKESVNALTELNIKYEILRKEKAKSDSNLKSSKKKLNDMEAYLQELENSTEQNLKILSETSQGEISKAQKTLKYTFRSIENYENIFKYLYESLLNRCIALRKDIKQKLSVNVKKTSKKQSICPENSTNENMKKAIDLASSVLNLTSNELEDILLTSNSVDNEQINFSFI